MDIIVELILSHKQLFSDVPSCTTVLQQDIDVGDSPPKPDYYPLPRMEDCVDRVAVLCKLDLLKRYWRVSDHTKNFSTFVTPNDFLQYTVMTSGGLVVLFLRFCLLVCCFDSLGRGVLDLTTPVWLALLFCLAKSPDSHSLG